MRSLSLFLLFIAYCISSCSHQCHHRGLSGITMQRGRLLTDTAALIIRFDKNGKFTGTHDSVYSRVVQDHYNTATISHATISYDFADGKYDYMVILLPSGETHQITEVSFGNERYKSGLYGTKNTACSLSYKVDSNINGRDTEYDSNGTLSASVAL